MVQALTVIHLSPNSEVIDLVAQYKTGAEAITAKLGASHKYLDQFYRAKCQVFHGMVFDTNCVCEPRNKELVPAYVFYVLY